MEPPAHRPYSFGPFLLDPEEKVLLRNGHPVPLPPKAFETLLALVERHGHVLGKAELLNRLWPDTCVEEATLAQNIYTLRKALGDSLEGRQYIETVPKRGYRFVAPVKEAFQESPPAASVTEPSRAGRGSHSQLRWVLSGAFLLLLVAGFTLWRYSANHLRVSTRRVMLAVLPFENLSGDPAQDYFSDGLTEEMITQLGGLDPEGLGVIARTSAMHYKGATETAGQIGRELRVDYLVEGSMRREGARVRISAQLIRVRDDTQLWAQDYDRDVGDLLTLESYIAQAIANEVAFKLAVKKQASHTSVRTVVPEAYEAYLKGRYFWNLRSEQGHLKAIEYFEQAITTDPEYSQAYTGLADAYALLGSNPTKALSRQEAMAKARAAALKALAIDDTLAEAHTSLAFVYYHYDWDWPAAEKEFRRALELNPSYATAHHWYAYYLMTQGRTEQALEEIRHAQESDPLSRIINTDVAEMLCYAQRYDQAIQQAQKALEMDSNFVLARRVLAWSYVQKRQYGEAIRELKKAMSVPGAERHLQGSLAATYAMAGQDSAARELLRQLEVESHRLQELWVSVAQVHGALGERDQAFAWLEKAFQARDGGVTLIKVYPFFDSLRSDPRFADLVRRIGLPP